MNYDFDGIRNIIAKFEVWFEISFGLHISFIIFKDNKES